MHLSRPRPAAALAALALLAAPALAGCGSDGAGDEATAAAPPPAHAHYLAAADLRLQLANAFRQGLYRLAVMSQPPDDASDLGQQLPTGSLEQVRCAARGARPADDAGQPWRWSCGVRWRTVRGAAQRTRYDVRLLGTGCFAAGATPRLPQHRDTTIAAYAEHPLNALVSARKGC